MESFRKILIVSLLLVACIAGAFWYGKHSGYEVSQLEEKAKQKISSESVLERIRDQKFLITKSLYLSEKTKITLDEGSKLQNFLWGKDLKAEAKVKVDVGLDLQKIAVSDILVDHAKKIITLHLPAIQIFDAALYGDIEVETKEGLLKKIFDDTKNADYNQAMTSLIEQAKKQVLEDTGLIAEMQADSQKSLSFLFVDTGYQLAVDTQKMQDSEETKNVP